MINKVVYVEAQFKPVGKKKVKVPTGDKKKHGLVAKRM